LGQGEEWWSFTFTPPYVLMMCLIKHRDNFTYSYVDTGSIANISEVHAASIFRVEVSRVVDGVYIGY
jgi:hypothetical protein